MPEQQTRENEPASESNGDMPIGEGTAFRPLTRTEWRTLWLKERAAQDFALQMWVKLVEERDWEIEVMLQMHGLLVFGTMISTQRYIQFYLELNEELHRESEPETAAMLKEHYLGMVPPPHQPEVGPAGLPTLFHALHMRDVTTVSGGHKIKIPYWRGKISAVDAFVIGATAEE